MNFRAVQLAYGNGKFPASRLRPARHKDLCLCPHRQILYKTQNAPIGYCLHIVEDEKDGVGRENLTSYALLFLQLDVRIFKKHGKDLVKQVAHPARAVYVDNPDTRVFLTRLDN